MIDSSILLAYNTYNGYANRLVLAAFYQLNEEERNRHCSPSHGSAAALLLHSLRAEAFFFTLCSGKPYPALLAGEPTPAQLLEFTTQHTHAQHEYIRSLTETGLAREVDFDLKEHAFRLPCWQLFMQAFVHSTHHRGELSIVLTSLGHPLPTLDIIIPLIEHSGQVWPSM